MKAVTMTTLRLPGTASAAVNFISCSQQQDNTSVVPPAGSIVTGNRQSDLQPGTPATTRQTNNPSERNEAAIAEGKKIYNHFNCSGCHAAGGGAIGPPLMDDEWIYGSSPANIYWAIIEGRPQGMPSFGGRIATDEVWRRAAYVRSRSGLGKETNDQKAEAT
jgi:cytochrome c oxidase cbb3-type subunit III